MSLIEIFRAGRHTPMTGWPFEASESDLDRTVAAYSKVRRPAPLVLGHPADDRPAYGVVSRLVRYGPRLFAECENVSSALKEAVRAKRYRNISASFFLPRAGNNPAPGSLYLKHVGFLGAVPPAVKGMDEPAFAEFDAGVLCFGRDSVPMTIEFHEVAETFTLPAGYAVNPERLALHRRAAAFEKAIPGLSYAEALRLAAY